VLTPRVAQLLSRRRVCRPCVLDHVLGDHAGPQVRSRVAMEQPGTWIVRHHVCHQHVHRQERRHIGAHVFCHHRVTVPVRRMKFEIGGGEQVPPHPFAFSHCERRSVAIEKPVDAFLQVADVEGLGEVVCLLDILRLLCVGLDVLVKVPTQVLVDFDESSDKLAIYIFHRILERRLNGGC